MTSQRHARGEAQTPPAFLLNMRGSKWKMHFFDTSRCGARLSISKKWIFTKLCLYVHYLPVFTLIWVRGGYLIRFGILANFLFW